MSEDKEKQEEFERDTKLNIHQRINAVMAEFDYIKKGNKIIDKTGKPLYSVTGHDAVTKMIHPLLVKHGINLIPSGESMTQEGNRTRIEMLFAWVNIDKPDEQIQQKWFSYGIDYSDKGPGSAFSYAQRYIILKTLHIETGEKDIEEHDTEFDDSEETTPTPPQSKPAPETTENKPNPPAPGGKKITKSQAGLVWHKFTEAGFSADDIEKYCQFHYQVDSQYSLPMSAVKVILALHEKDELKTVAMDKYEADDIPF